MDEELTDEEENELLIRVLRKRVREAQYEIDEKEKEKTALMVRHEDIVADIRELTKLKQQAASTLKMLLPIETKEEQRDKIKRAVYAKLRELNNTDDREVAVSRLCNNHLLEFGIEIPSFEQKVRDALKTLQIEGVVTSRQVTTSANRQATIWSVTEKELEGA